MFLITDHTGLTSRSPIGAGQTYTRDMMSHNYSLRISRSLADSELTFLKRIKTKELFTPQPAYLESQQLEEHAVCSFSGKKENK